MDVETSNTQEDQFLNRIMQRVEAKMDQLFLDKLSVISPQHVQRANEKRPQREENERQPDLIMSDYEDTPSEYAPRPRRFREPRDRRETQTQTQNVYGHVKVKIPEFYGKNDPDIYLDWEKKVDLIFDCQDVPERNRLKLVVTEFCGYALSWWETLVSTRRRCGEEPVVLWDQLKRQMRKRFVPTHYQRELHQRLRRLTQGSKKVEEYFQDLETLLLRANIHEDHEATMSRFLGGLNRDIQDRLELQYYEEIEEMLHKAILIEQQLNRRSTKSTMPPNVLKFKDVEPSYPKEKAAVFDPKEDTKGKVIFDPNKSRDIRCFKCQGRGHMAKDCINKRAFILLDNGEVVTDDEAENEDSPDEYEESPPQGELLVVQRTLSVQTKSEDQAQRENLFHTRCVVHDKVCSLIIDGGSCTNVASVTMVQKLGLTVRKHPRPYKLQWLNEKGEMKVGSQVTRNEGWESSYDPFEHWEI